MVDSSRKALVERRLKAEEERRNALKELFISLGSLPERLGVGVRGMRSCSLEARRWTRCVLTHGGFRPALSRLFSIPDMWIYMTLFPAEFKAFGVIYWKNAVFGRPGMSGLVLLAIEPVFLIML